MPFFPATFPWRFGGYAPPDDLFSIEGTSLAWTEDHPGEGADLLLLEFKDKPRIEAYLRAMLAGVQDLEDGIYQVLTERWLDTAVGAQLDRLGQILDLGRAGWPDEIYRTLLRAQILAYKSEGTWPDLLAIVKVVGFDLTLTAISEWYPAGIRVELGEAPGEAIEADDLFNLLERARAGGVRLEFIWPVDDPSESFTFDLDTTPDQDDAMGFGDSVAGGIGGTLSGVLDSSAGV